MPKLAATKPAGAPDIVKRWRAAVHAAGGFAVVAYPATYDNSGITTFIVNLRHALYSASLAPHMKHLPARWLIPLGFWLTDESFVVVIARYTQPDASPFKHWYFLGSALFMYINWNICTLIGVIAARQEKIGPESP